MSREPASIRDENNDTHSKIVFDIVVVVEHVGGDGG